MFRIVRRSREQLIVDGYEAQLAEKERLVMLLAEQVEYLRAQLNMPTASVTRAAGPPPERRHEFDMGGLDATQLAATNQLTDEEEELLAMHQAGVLNGVEYQQALERLAGRSADDIIE